jgi:hypothetical protein
MGEGAGGAAKEVGSGEDHRGDRGTESGDEGVGGGSEDGSEVSSHSGEARGEGGGRRGRVGGDIWRLLGALTGTPLGPRARARWGGARRPAPWLRGGPIDKRIAVVVKRVVVDGIDGTHTKCRRRRKGRKQPHTQHKQRHLKANGGMNETGKQLKDSGSCR